LVQHPARYLLPAEFGIRLLVPGFQLPPKDLISANAGGSRTVDPRPSYNANKKDRREKKDAVRHFRLGVHIVEERTVGCVRRKGRGLQYA
jgi:hypothetical protein